MTRTLYLSLRPPPDLPGTVLTLNRRAAERFQVPAVRLSELAAGMVDQAGIEVASPALSQRLLTRAVREVLRPQEPVVLARQMLSPVRELFRTGLPLGEIPTAGTGRVAQLVQVTLTYQELLLAADVIDPAEVITMATPLAQPRVLSMTSQPRLQPDEQRFFDAACAAGSVIHLPWAEHPYFQESEAAAAFFSKQGWDVQRVAVSPAGLAGAFLGGGTGGGTLHVLPNEDAEVRAALQQVTGLIGRGIAPDDIALVVPDDERWEGLVSAVAREYGVPMHFTTSVAAADTRPGRWILRAVEALDSGFSFDAVTRLLAHPLDTGLDGPTWRELRLQQPAGWQDWRAAGLALETFHWPDSATRAQWAQHLQDMLAERGIQERAQGHDKVALDFIGAALRELASPSAETLTRVEFLTELRELLSLVTVPTQLGGQGVELLTPPALIGGHVPHVFFLGMTDGGLPVALQDDPQLDFLTRKKLHAAGLNVETAGTLSRRSAVIFWGALAACGEATFSYARLSARASALPSPYLAPLRLTEVPYPQIPVSFQERQQATLLDTEQASDELHSELLRRYQVELQRLEGTSYSEYDGLGLPAVNLAEKTFSASQLGTLGRCGFRWWLEYGLHLQDDQEDRTAASLGTLRHAVLKRAMTRAQGVPAEQVREVLLAGLGQDWRESEAALAWPQEGSWERKRPEHLEALRQLIQSADFLTGSAVPVAFEKAFTGHWYGFEVRGTVDRIDDLGGKLVVVDYKSGSSKPLGVQDRERKLNLDIQLPIYAQAALPALFPEQKFGGAHYLSLRTGKIIDRIKVTPAEYEALAERLMYMLRTGSFPPQPDIDFKVCRLCQWQTVCRMGPRLEHKEFP